MNEFTNRRLTFKQKRTLDKNKQQLKQLQSMKTYVTARRTLQINSPLENKQEYSTRDPNEFHQLTEDVEQMKMALQDLNSKMNLLISKNDRS